MRLKQGIRTSALLALALLWAGTACAHDRHHRHHDRHQNRYEHRQEHRNKGHGHRHDFQRNSWKDQGRYTPRTRYRPVTFTHYVRGRPVRVVMHQPYYCARCSHHYKQEDSFLRHLKRDHGIARHVRRHLSRIGQGWVYFG